MEIEIPPWLQWVSYLAGDTWPQGRRIGMDLISETLDAAALDLDDLIPDLNMVRGETLSALIGETAQVADQRFSMLFDGDYAVDKLSEAVRALSESALYVGSEIEYAKLSIVVGLALAAAEISWSLSMSGPTGGASLGWIPVIEMLTIAAFRRWVVQVMGRVVSLLRTQLGRTMVLREVVTESGQEFGIWATQEGTVAGIQGDRYNPNSERLLLGAVASTVGGGAGGGTAVPVSAGLGPAASKLGRAGKGMTTFFTAGIAGNVVGTTVVGGNPFENPLMVVASSTTSSVGGVRGAGVMPGSDSGRSSNGQRPPPGAPPPDGPRPDGPDDGPQSDDDSRSPAADPESTSVNGSRNDDRTAGLSDNAPVSDAPIAEPAADTGQSTNDGAAQNDSSPSMSDPTTDRESDAVDGAPQNAHAEPETHDGETSTASPSSQPADNGEVPTQSSDDDPTLIGTDAVGETPSNDPTPATPVTDDAPFTTENGHIVDGAPADVAPLSVTDAHPDPTSSTIADPGSDVDAASQQTATPTQPAGSVGTPPTSPSPAQSPTAVPTPADTSTSAPAAGTPNQQARPNQVPSRAGDQPAPDTDQPVSDGDQPAAQGDQPVPGRNQPVPDEAAAASPTAAASANQPTVSPVAGISDAAATPAQNSTDQADTDQPTKADTGQPTKEEAGPTIQHRIVIPSPRPRRSLNDCLQRVAKRLSEKYGKPIRLVELPSARGTPARVLFQAVGSGSEFATYAEVADELGRMEPGSSAIVTSVWANGPRQGGHAYLAVNVDGRVYLEDPDTGQRTPWPPSWGQDAVVRSAVAYLDANGNATNPLHDTRQLVAAAAVGHVQGHPDGEESSGGDGGGPGDRWQHVQSQQDLADGALAQRGLEPQEAHKLRHPLGTTEAARELGRYRAQDNAKWWNGLTGEQQRALIETYPQHIGNAEGIPADARDAANRLSLEQDRSELQARRDRGERLTGQQRKQLARYDRIQAALDRAAKDAKKVGGPLLLAFDPFAFGGDGRAMVSFGHDPYKADSVSVHVPGRGMDIDQIGPTMGDALKQLQSTLREDSNLKASSIAWIGYDTASGWKGLRAAGRSFARTGGAILCGDIQAFNAVRATPAAIHIFGHSYGSTTTSYAAEGGRLRSQVRTITLVGSPGAGPLKNAADAGIGPENVYVASSSRDPFTALGGRTRASFGRIFGFGLGMDPAMESFGAQRITAEFSAEMDSRRTNLTHNAYYRYVDRTADPPVRSESLANFGRIAASTPVDTDPRRTVDERPWYQFGWRTVEPADGRPLRLADDTTGDHSGDRDTRRPWNPHWHAQSGQVEPQNVAELPAAASPDPDDGPHVDDSDDPGQSWKHVPSQEDLANAALAQRGLKPAQANKLRNPLGLMEAACERAGDNATWWNDLTGEQQRALIDTYPQHIGNAEGITADARDAANRLALDQDRKDLQARRDRGERLTGPQRKQLARLDRIQAALDRAAKQAEKADVGKPRLLAFDPYAFGGDGRAIVSLGHDPYKADSVSVHVPGIAMTIDELGPSMGFALNQLQSTLHENPDLNASSIVWLGYDTPSGPWQAASDRFARAGANILYSDIRAFNTVRDTPAAIHIFAHSYGSTTASYAGRDGRLANDIRTVSLIGSPGAGPLDSADEFGPDVDVYVATSSRDPIAALGGRTPGSRGRIFGRGLGIDPSMQSFGAQRITAEFSAEMDRRRNTGTHNAYYNYVNRTAGVRSESLANFGRIAAGKPVDSEQHRTIRGRPLRRPHIRTVEPAQGRPLQLADDTTGAHAGDRDTQRLWNPRWLRPDAPDGTAHTPDDDNPPEPHTPTTTELLKAALEARGVGPDELVSPADHRVPVDQAVARAKANAEWWKGLSDPDSDGFSDVQWALIRTYPFEIGNAEGIPPMARHEANSIMLQRWLAHRDVLQSRRDNGVALDAKQERFLELMNDIESALRSAERNAGRANVGGPYLLALDPQAFDGVGRAIVSFGADPYTAKSVSWYVPGMSTTIEKLRAMMLRSFNTLQSTLRENTDPDFSAASITYLGYKPPGSWDVRVVSQTMAREGGEIFAADMLSFNAGREIITGTPFSNHHVFAHSYGSSTVSHAGHGQRLAGQVQTITLIGSPGAGPLQHARDFGIGAENVFVAASSRDRTTGLGGERPGDRGRTVRRMGQGIDPAMDSFGARRITAEFPAALDHMGRGSRMTHSIYWAYMDPGLNPQVRSESLTNFGRIAAGRADRVDREGHRTLRLRRRWLRKPVETTVEPARGRPLRIADDPTTHHPVNRRHYWNPRFRSLPAESVDVGSVDEGVPSPAELLAADVGDVEQGPVPDRVVADLALEARGVGPDELVSPADHRVPQDQAVARAKANAEWWKGLSDPDFDGFSNAQWALIRAYPFQIGNAEGIPPMARHEANSIMLQRWLAHRDVLLSRRDNGVALNAKQERFLELMNDIESALRSGERIAGRANVGGPYLLALDPRAFDGVGRAIVSFGADPYTAKSVSWYVPGMSTTIEKLRAMMLRSFNTLQSTLRENTDPDFTAASITYLGYKPPGSWDPQVLFQKLAREGGEIFAADMLAFNAGRDIFAGDGSHFRNHHVFAHSYGSSTVSHAGHGQRLAGQVQTITLIGSPGAGPLHHARDFGIGEENVFVAASSRDRTTGLGGERAGDRGRTVRRMGQGIDPAMDSFGARRITAEFPAALDHMGRGSRMTHSIYWAYLDPGLDPHVRSESLTNFGRIAAGRADRVDREGHRTLGERRRLWRKPVETTVEPARGRPLRIADDPTTHHLVNGRNYWNPTFLRDIDCGHGVIDELSVMYEDHDPHFTLDAPPSPRGVPAWKLFKAIGSRSRFQTYAQIERDLKKLGHGSSALLASRWRGRGQGGHAYLARNNNNKIEIFDPHDGEWTDWPPPWSEKSISRTAVGYLKANGEAVQQYDGSTRDLAAASLIGRVQGHPDPDLVADALGQRMPRVGAADLVTPLGWAELAAARAELNATWWSGLSPEQRQELVKAHPYEIGNAEGIFPEHRNDANQRVLQGYRDRAAEYQARHDNGERLSAPERRLMERVNRIDAALQEAAAAAERAGLDPPLLLGFDPRDFGGNGRALISFGTDPSQAERVSWHTTRQPIEQLGTGLHTVLDQLQSTREETPTAAAIICVGKEASKLRLPWDNSRKPGPDGVLNSDLAAFRAARTAWERTGDGAPLNTNRVHSVRASSTSVAERSLLGGTDTRPSGLWVPPGAGSLVAAHRGASHEFPEQTLPAYEEALRQGADGLECDIRLTKDGHIVCIHDKRVDRTSNGTGLVGDMTLAELRALDFGGWHPSRDLGDAQGDTGILNLERLIELVQNQDRPVTLFAEVKERNGNLERALVELLNRHGLTNPTSADQARVAVISFYPDPLLRVRNLAPNLPTVQLGPALLGPGTRLLASMIGATAIGPSIQTLRANPELVDLAASQGLDTYCWTVNDQRDVQYARDLGVHWIATDHPGRTNTWLRGEPTNTPARETVHLTSEPDATEAQPAVEETSAHDAEHTPAKLAFVHELSETEAKALRVEEALAQRHPRVRPDELRNPVDMVDSNPADMADEASARARNNAAWWKGLTADQRQDLIEAYPQHIGNAEGIPPKDRDAANQLVLEQLREHRDRVLDKIHRFKLPSLEELKLLRRVNRLDTELRKASADAKRAGVDGPLLLAFDPAEFGGDGRAVLSFGHDPYDADSVSVHVPGVGTTVNSRFFFGFYASCALNHLVSTRQENPNLKAASIAWIGYDTPSGRKIARMRNQELARAGGELLYSDVRSFSEGRARWNGSDGRAPQVHVFGYSYGSTTTAHAGVGGRLADYVSTVSLVGSPGAGPLQEAGEFGLEDGKVYVASSSRDLVTGLGGRTQGSTSRILGPIARMLGLGLGIDPAMESFGAVRVTAEVPVAMNRPHILGTHDTYYQFANMAGDPRVRSEALANFGRIAAGRTEGLHLERHRTEGDRRGILRTVEPAGERSVHRFGNPAWLRADARRDPELLQRQADYRAQDRTTRRVDTRYAQPLGDVVDSAGDTDSARQLAEDLSGVYGPFRIRLGAERFGTEIRLTGAILNGDTEIGSIQAILDRDGDGKLVAYHSGVFIKPEYADLRGHGFSRALTAELERYYVHSGVDRIELWTHDLGGNIWARRGFTWNPDPQKLQVSLNNIKHAADTLSSRVSAEARRALDEMVQRLEPDHPRLPEPIEIANLATAGEPELGRRLLESVSLHPNHGLHLVRYLPVETQLLTSQPRKGFRALLQRWFGLGADRRSLGEPDCGRGVVAAWGRRYGRDVPVPVPRSSTGLPAWAVFEATGSGSRFATDDEVFAALQDLGPGSSAILASRFSDRRWGGHARFAVNDGGRIYVEECYNERTSERLDWPPQGAVSQTAVGYFDSDGNPVRPLHDVPLQLEAADAIGDVRGLPEESDFQRRQQEYRAQDPTTRRVDPNYAEPLGDVVDSASSAGAGQLAKDLSGVYGPYAVALDGYKTSEGQVVLDGEILSGERQVGLVAWRFYRDGEGSLVAHLDRHVFDETFRGSEFSTPLIWDLVPYFVRSGVDRITSTPSGHDVYSGADLGDTWDPDPENLRESLDNIKRSAQQLAPQVSTDALALLADIVERLDPTHPRLPEPLDLARLATPGEPDLGRRLLDGTGLLRGGGVHYVKYLWNARLHPGQNCGHWAIKRLSERFERFGREFHLEGEPSRTGVPARTLFEAIGSRADSMTYSEVEELLLQMDPGKPGEPGPAALLVSSWAGGQSRGGHAYLAVLDGGRVYLEDPFTGERSPWPPYWGEGAVSHTAVGFLNANGRAVQPLASQWDLVAADMVGDVAGHPDDADFQRAQQDYRGQDRKTRRVDTRYAEPLGDVLDNASDTAHVDQLAEDLSGVYRPYLVELAGLVEDDVGLGGRIRSGEKELGPIYWSFRRDGEGKLVVDLGLVEIRDKEFRGQGFSKSLAAILKPYFERSGVDRVEVTAGWQGAYTWAKWGLDWNPDPAKLRESLDYIGRSASELLPTLNDEGKRVIEEVMERLDPDHARLPSPSELARLTAPGHPDLGRELLENSYWHGVMYLGEGES